MSDFDESISRFKAAQNQTFSGYESAVAELRAGRKTGHWIWYIFPQLSGLGMSAMSQTYGIADAAEATEYLRDRVLRDRLLAATEIVAQHVGSGVPVAQLMGSSIDATKLVSSLTLFGTVAARLGDDDESGGCRRLAGLAAQVLAAADAQGYKTCEVTRRRLSGS